MEEIKSLRDKHKLPSASDLKAKLQETLAFMKTNEENHTYKLAEEEREIQMLTSKLSFLKEEISKESSILETKSNDLKKYQQELESLESELKTGALELHELQCKRDNLKMMKPNTKDQRVIEQGVRKLNLLKEITGIRWSYKDIEESTKGYVTNKVDYIQPFCYEPKTMSEKDLNNLLWKEIETMAKCSNLEKEACTEHQTHN